MVGNELKHLSILTLEKLVSEAGRWAGESTLGFTMSGAEEQERYHSREWGGGTRKISFRAPCGSFFVTVLENVDSEEWVSIVWLVWVDQLVTRQ